MATKDDKDRIGNRSAPQGRTPQNTPQQGPDNMNRGNETLNRDLGNRGSIDRERGNRGSEGDWRGPGDIEQEE